MEQSSKRGSGLGRLVPVALVLVALSVLLWVITPWSNFGAVRGQGEGAEQTAADNRAERLNVGLDERIVTIERDGAEIARFTAEIADTPERQQIGLMNRTELAPDRGMLFIWDPPTIVAMWMRDTLIPLDFVYVRLGGVIVDIRHDVPPCEPGGHCPAYAAPEPVAYVLEIPGGRAEELGLRAGDRLVIGELIE